MANEHIQAFVQAQKKTYEKCLHGDLTCGGKPVNAHSIQNANVLKRIHTGGDVLMPGFRLANGEPKLDFLKIGRNDASTFTGLCSKHDTELFKAIDTEPLDVDNCNHLQQLAYRSVMRELHTHLLNGEKFWRIHENSCKADGLDPNETPTEPFVRYLHCNDKAREVLNYRNRHFDLLLSEGKLPDLWHFVITMDDQAPVLAASAFFSVDFSTDGDIIGPMLNVVPLSENRSVAVISCPAWQMFEVRRALCDLFDADEKTLKYELAKLIIQRVENFVLSPAHVEKWSDGKKARVLREFEANLEKPHQIDDHEDLNIFV